MSEKWDGTWKYKVGDTVRFEEVRTRAEREATVVGLFTFDLFSGEWPAYVVKHNSAPSPFGGWTHGVIGESAIIPDKEEVNEEVSNDTLTDTEASVAALAVLVEELTNQVEELESRLNHVEAWADEFDAHDHDYQYAEEEHDHEVEVDVNLR